MKAFYVGLMSCVLLPCVIHGEVVFAPAENSTVATSQQFYDRQGHPLRSLLSSQDTYAQNVTLEQISPWLILATIAAEDRRFYTHPGIDWRAVLRAGWQNIYRRHVVSGASTITQQLARALNPRRKVV